MARRRNVKRKRADETLVDIIEVRDQAQGFVDRYQNYLFGGLTVLVLLVGGYLAYQNFYQKPRQQTATEQMFQAQVQFERDSFALALTNPGGGYSGFLDIIENYKGTKAANLANYYAGVSYLQLGQYVAALDYLKDFKASGEVTPIMKWGAFGDCFSELNDLEKAMKYDERAVSAGENSILTPYYLKKVGLLHEHNGDLAEAKKTFEKIKAEYPDSPDGQDIDKFITRVDSGS